MAMTAGELSPLERRIERITAAASRLTIRQGGVALGVICAAVFVILLAFRIDIGPAKDFLDDAIVRDFAGELPVRRFYDLSPHYAWLPSDLFVWDNIRSGNLPLWERLQGGGYSPVVALYNGVLHPLRWATALAPRDFAPTALILFGFTAALFGSYRFAATELSLSPAAALLGAFVFVFGGPFVSFSQFSGSLLPVAHLPWLLLWLRRSVRTGDRRALALLALGFASLLASGHPSIAFVVGAGVGLFALLDAIATRSIRPLVTGAAGVTLGLGLAAPVLLPVLVGAKDLWTYKTQTSDGVSYGARSFSGWTSDLTATLFDTCAGTCFHDSNSFFYYVGLGAAVLAFIALVRPRSTAQGPVILLSAALFAVLVLPGPWMEPFERIPPISYLKQWYLIGPFAFFFAMGCTIGAQRLLVSKRREARVVLLCAVLFIVPTYLLRTVWALGPHVSRPLRIGPVIERLAAIPETVRVTGLWGQTHQVNSARLTGIEDLRLAAPMLPLRYHLWFNLVDPGVLRKAFPTARITDELSSPLVGDFNVAFVLQSRLRTGIFTTHPDPRYRDRFLSPRMRAPQFPVMVRTPSLEVRVNKINLRRRAEFVGSTRTVPGLEAAVQMLTRERALPLRTAVVESARPLGDVRGTGTVKVAYPSDSRVTLTADSPTGGLVVLHDAFAPGWTATIDGKPADVLPVNVLSRGVVVPPGQHRVEMRYMPPGLIMGFVISLILLAALACWTLFPRKGADV